MHDKKVILMVSDQLLVEGCKAGDRTSQFRLYDLYARKMMGICLRYSQSRTDAEDILQEGFLRIFKYMHDFKGHGSLEGWIRAVIVNCALSRYKNNARLPKTTAILEESLQIGSAENIEENINYKKMIELIQNLSPVYRMVFNLFVFEGYKHREIARILNISEGTSKSNLSSARMILRNQLVIRELTFDGLAL